MDVLSHWVLLSRPSVASTSGSSGSIHVLLFAGDDTSQFCCCAFYGETWYYCFCLSEPLAQIFLESIFLGRGFSTYLGLFYMLLYAPLIFLLSGVVSMIKHHC